MNYDERRCLLGRPAALRCAKEFTLAGRLFTTYDRADTRLLAENVLPVFLGLARQPAHDGEERQHFLLELDKALKDRRGRIVIVSSSTRDEPTLNAASETASAQPYPWILPLIREHATGRTGRAVQHAKLWMLHWSAGDGSTDEFLELVVSSANLTRAAFRGQIQCAWRVCLPLRLTSSQARRKGWGVLPDFLTALATSAGIRDRLSAFLELLARADRPDGVTFLASVPGTHSKATLRTTPWGVAGLNAVVPEGAGHLSCTILSPFIGGWSTTNLAQWASAFGADVRRLGLIWIEQNHPWAFSKQWMLPRSSLQSLILAGAAVHLLPYSRDDHAMLHPEHSTTDARWSHAKAYRFKRGRTSTVLLTSANFSPSAWGLPTSDGRLTIRNFELGVSIAGGAWPTADLPVCASPTSL